MEAPKEFEARERALLGPRFETLFASPTPQPARGVTVNTLRCTPAAFAALADFPLAPSPFCAAAFGVPAELRPGRHPYHHAGAFYAQEPSAAAPAALLDVRPGQRVADLCAAPGGKAAQLAAALRGQGLLLANEVMPVRAEALRQNLERMGAANVVVTSADTARLAAALPGFFDRVLVDAPCSGEGMFRKEPAAAAQYSPALVAHCAALGRKILDDAVALLAPGGVLVYSTCTFSPQEDEAQIAALLARCAELELCDLSACGFGRPGEGNRAPAAFAAERCRRIWPADGGEGHFMARLQKKPAAPPPADARKARAGSAKAPKTDKAPKIPPEWQEFCAAYFPSLAACVPQAEDGRLRLWPDGARGLPLGGARVLCGGVLLGEARKRRFEPAHALFMAYGAQCANREELTLADPRTAAWLRGEEIPAATARTGWCAVLVDGFPLGGGKVSGGTIKNHYPKGLRNLK